MASGSILGGLYLRHGRLNSPSLMELECIVLRLNILFPGAGSFSPRPVLEDYLRLALAYPPFEGLLGVLQYFVPLAWRLDLLEAGYAP